MLAPHFMSTFLREEGTTPRLFFWELPKTISGKIRRVELRTTERERGDVRPGGEYRDEDFPDLKS